MSNPSVNKVKVALVMPEGLLCDGICLILKEAGYSVVATEHNLDSLENKFSTIKPEVVMVDCDIANNSLDELTKLVADRKVKVAVLYQNMEDIQMLADVKVGISCLCLQDTSEVLVEEMKMLALGDTVISREILGTLRGKEDLTTERRLSQRENDELCYVGQGYSNEEIAEKLYISEYTVKGHVHSILCKLNLRNRQEATAYVIKKGMGKTTLGERS
ncbi:Transcriptional regulatory protein LnrK [subsurface metagenome]